MQSSKKNTYVFKHILKPLPPNPEADLPLQDTLRNAMGKYWVGGPGTLEYGDEEQANNFPNSYHMSVSYGPMATKLLAASPFTSKEQVVYFTGDDSYWGADPEALDPNGNQQAVGTWDGWQAQINNLVPSPTIPLHDDAFRIDTPFNQAERLFLGDISGLGFIDVDFNYNYYIELFENATRNIREEVLPNVYAFISENISRNMYYLKTLRGLIADSHAPHEFSYAIPAFVTAPEFDPGPLYFVLVSSAYQSASASFWDDFSTRYKNYIVPFENLELMNSTTLHHSFPMFVKVSFSTDSVTEVAQILENASLATSLQRDVAAGIAGTNSSLYDLIGGYMSSYWVGKQNLSYTPTSDAPTIVSDGTYKSLDLLVWWQRYLGGLIPNVYGDQTFVGPNTHSVYISSGAQDNSLIQALSLLIFSGKLSGMIKDKNRSFEEVMNGAPCHTETILYRIAKFKGSPDNNEPIQSYWFPNSNKIDVINLVDTQVKYDTQYTYVVYAYQLVIGTDYSYGAIYFGDLQENTEIFQECSDIEFPADLLNGTDCFITQDVGLGPQTGLETGCVDADVDVIAGQGSGSGGGLLETLDVDTSNMDAVAEAVITIYVFSGNLDALLPENAVYAVGLASQLAGRYGWGVEDFISALAAAVANYSAGAIVDISYPADVETTVTYDYEYTAHTKVTTFPSVKLVEVPFFSHTGKIIDSPPLPPDVNIIPYRGINNKVLIWLNSTVGEQALYPIPIYQSDAEAISQIWQNNFMLPTDPIVYKSDDTASAFEILRLTKKPEKYADFANNQRAYLTTVLESGTFKRASAASFVDSVVPNKKYYYTFRAIDEHQNVSNPTKVFEIELVDNDGAVFMVTNIIPLEENLPPYDPVKVAKRYVHVVPRITQGLFNAAQSGLQGADSVFDSNSYALGVEDESIWGRKFKIRFISKSTGRKIDLNITYDKGHKVSPEEQYLTNVDLTDSDLEWWESLVP